MTSVEAGPRYGREGGPILWCLLAAALFGAATPASKPLLEGLSPLLLSGALYLGAAIAVAPWALRNLSDIRSVDPKSLIRLLGAVIFGGVLGPVLLRGPRRSRRMAFARARPRGTRARASAPTGRAPSARSLRPSARRAGATAPASPPNCPRTRASRRRARRRPPGRRGGRRPGRAARRSSSGAWSPGRSRRGIPRAPRAAS